MTLSPQFLDELRARITLSALIAPTVKLTKAGREFKACCPFHNEKSPSFYVNDEKGFYHCFGCGAHGDAIRFLTDARGLPFIDAVKELAGKAGLDMPAPDPREREKQERSAGLHDVMAAAQAWFAEQLNGIDGGEARAYLAKRGIDAKATTRFGIGFAPDSRGKLKIALGSFAEDKLVDSGMLIRPDDSKATYDRFRGRLMIPVRDPRGRVIAFGGRIIGAGEPKYLNSPDTPLFDKGRTLYNLDLASPASRAANRVIVVEGYMDVIALDRAGIGEAVAPNGTALTEAQLERLWRLEPAPICCFDGDAAGQKAAVRAAVRALPFLAPERTLRFVALPAGQDPDDVVKAGGKPAIEALLAAPEPLVERLWRHEVDAAPLDTPEARAGLKARLMDHAAQIGDPNVRQLYRDEWLRRFDALIRPQAAGRGSGSFKRKRSQAPGSRQWAPTEEERFLQSKEMTATTRSVGSMGLDPSIVAGVVYGHALFPEAIADNFEILEALPVADGPIAMLKNRIIDLFVAGQALDRIGLIPILASDPTSAAWSDLKKSRKSRFSFTRVDSDPDLARRDLGLAVEALIATGEIQIALNAATKLLETEFTDEAFSGQQRLIEARQLYNDRLASLAGND